MDVMDEIIKLISNLGFPIFCCVVLFFQNNKFQEALNKLTDTLLLMEKRLEDIEKKLK